MADLISREAFKEALLTGAEYLDEDTLMTVVNILDTFPITNAVVLPCKVGDTVFVTDIVVGRIIECEVECFGDFDGSDEMTVEYRLPKEIPNIVSQIAPCDEFGKTIFLTREEAEKALEGRGDNAD